MACNDCHKLTSIPECSESLYLGAIFPEVEIDLYVKNMATGYVHRQEETADFGGNIMLNLTQPDPSFYNQDGRYEIWATFRSNSERLAIAYTSGRTNTCLSVEFFMVD